MKQRPHRRTPRYDGASAVRQRSADPPVPVERVELRPEAMVAGGDAMGTMPDGRKVFVNGALPGESVIAAVNVSKKDYVKATMVEVLTAAPARRVPPCPSVAKGCGGCGWQHIEPGAQMGYKVAVVADALRRLGRVADPRVDPWPALAAERVRTTVRVAADRDGRLGYRAARSHDVVVPQDCLVVHPLLTPLFAVRADPGTEVTLRVGARTGEALAYGAGLRHVPPGVRTGDSAYVTEIVHGRSLRASAGSFFQSSPQAAEALIDAVTAAAEEHASGSGPFADLYGGVGLFASALGRDRPTTLVELSPSSSADARVNVPFAEVVERPVEHWPASPAELVVADPARSGLGAGGVSAVAATGCHRLVLVSCDAASLGRDTRLLADAGFQHVSSQVLDPFPHTPHVEVVTAFARRAG